VARVGRKPGGGKVWREWQHPRDDRGRFAKKGGAKWATRVVRAAGAGFADLGSNDQRTPIRSGRLPGGVLDLGALSRQGRKAGQDFDFMEEVREVAGTPTHISNVRIGDEVKVDGEWRQVWGTGFGKGEHHISWRDAAGSQFGEITSTEKPTVFVRAAPRFEAAKALKRGGEQEARMRQWEADAKGSPPFTSMTRREAELLSRENDVAGKQVALNEATRKARNRANRRFPKKEGYSQQWRDEYIDRETWHEQWELRNAQASLDYLRAAELGPYDSNVDVLSLPRMHDGVDRSRPLALYGNMLHAKAYDEASFRALAELESIPFELHQIVAAAMVRAQKRNIELKVKKGNAGIYVGMGGSADLIPEYFADFAHEKPRGWHEGATYHDVSGTFSPSIFAIAIGHTKNREGSKHSAAEHEFGHALDAALKDPANHMTASEQPEWNALHDRVLANHGPGLNPYFEQPGHAGRQEFWAEAFAVWVRAYRMAIATERDDERQGIRSLGGDGYRASRTRRALEREFKITDSSTLDDLHSYFLKLTAGAGVQW
jgi:hypothetical protein